MQTFLVHVVVVSTRNGVTHIAFHRTASPAAEAATSVLRLLLPVFGVVATLLSDLISVL